MKIQDSMRGYVLGRKENNITHKGINELAIIFAGYVYNVLGWMRNYCIILARSVVLENTLVSPLDCKEIKTVNPKGNQPWIFTGRTDTEAETSILWPLGEKSQLIGSKDPDAGKEWRQEENGTAEDELIGWHHWLNRHDLEQALGELMMGREAWPAANHGSQRVGQDWATRTEGRTFKKDQKEHKKNKMS